MQLPANRKLDKYLGYCLIALLLPVTRLLGIMLRRNHRLQQPPQYLLFIKLLGLGSLVVATDAIVAMKQKFPNTRFILLTDSNIAAGIEPFDVFDEIWEVETGNLSATISTSFHYIVKSWSLKNLWVVDLEVYSKLTTIYALLTMAPNRFGFHLRPVFFRKYLNTHNILFQQSAFLEDNYLHMAQIITGTQNILPHEQPLPIQKEASQNQYILLNNTCSTLAPVRKMPDAVFSAVCTWILENTPYRIAFLGAGSDKETIDQFVNEYIPAYKVQGKIVNIAGALDFEAYYRFIADKGVCLVTIDSGPLHIARKLGLPTVSVWGPTNPANYLKIRPGEEQRHVFVYNKVPCSPCVHHYEKLPCGGNNFCMTNITAESIIDKLSLLLNELTLNNEAVSPTITYDHVSTNTQKEI